MPLKDKDTERPRTVAGRVTQDTYDRLRWLAYRRDTTVSEIVAAYVEKSIVSEDFAGYCPPG